MYKKIFLLSLLLFSCAKTDPVTGEKILIEQDGFKKARENADKGGGLFGTLGKDVQNRQGQGNVNFGSSNVLWRATLKSLDFLPLINADYSGGIIIYDWYSESSNSNEQIKITVKFLSNELRTESVEISSHKKICDQNQKCFTKKTDGDFNKSIKENILAEARKLRIAEEKKK
jgi:hypothetical protein